MNKKEKNRKGVLYSTDPDFEYEYENDESKTLDNHKQNLEVWIDKKHRAGKTCVLIKGFIGKEDDLKSLAKILKSKCGVGGSVKNGEILIQGNVRDKIIDILEKEGYNTKKVGGYQVQKMTKEEIDVRRSTTNEMGLRLVVKDAS